MKRLAWLAGIGVWIGVACGGNVVVDGPAGDGGFGGDGAGAPTSGPGGNGGNGGNGGMGAGCPVPFPVGEVTFCGGAVSSGPGGPGECASFFCDQGGNQFTSECSGSTCVCSFNANTLCTCAVNTGDICAGTAQPCCPFPFVQ